MRIQVKLAIKNRPQLFMDIPNFDIGDGLKSNG